MRSKILQFLKNHDGEYFSGEEISRQLKVSRTAVWKHIQALKSEGYDIESHTRLGYRLKESPDLLLPQEVCPQLKTTYFGQEFHYYDDVPSTNRVAKEKAVAGSPEGTVVLAESQNQGKGRLSRGWYSPHGQGIWLSVVLRPPFLPSDAPKCNLMAAVALKEAIYKVTGINCGIKWPNDLLIDGKKIVGILTEMNAELDQIHFVVIGMGLNCNQGVDLFPEELREIATSLAIVKGEKISRKKLLAQILYELEYYYETVKKEGFTPILNKWRENSITLNREVRVIGFNETYGAFAEDIDEDGALVVVKDGQRVKVLAGDVSIRTKE